MLLRMRLAADAADHVDATHDVLGEGPNLSLRLGLGIGLGFDLLPIPRFEPNPSGSCCCQSLGPATGDR
ncbi:GD18890 [Drosophila simulans]|uniref:GD18890 n=1 Tax=Drosophila simulans TaxID=7240 RepID=B4R1V2_DROSI|nr:GD18890 [Drosophila simulans]